MLRACCARYLLIHYVLPEPIHSVGVGNMLLLQPLVFGAQSCEEGPSLPA